MEINKTFCESETLYMNGGCLNKFIICKMDSVPAGDLMRQNITSQFPCLFPVNPQMYKKLDRLQTFKVPNIWPHHIFATPNELTDAGFFYLGESDRVKCFYCNGGLRNWKSDERPWEEHAKWFPLCEYVLQRQGVDYVIQTIKNFPYLKRPMLQNPSTAPETRVIKQLLKRLAIMFPPKIQDPRLNEEKVERAMKSDKTIQCILKLEVAEGKIRKVLTKQFQTYDKNFNDIEELLKAIADATSGEERNCIEALKKAEQEQMCCKCTKTERNVLFLPCGHLVTCVNCAKYIVNCTLCEDQIKEKIRTYKC